jgi:hypothetical protein
MNRKFIFLYLFILGVSFFLYEIFSPTTYPILLLLTGNGRFNDWWLTLWGVSRYPEVVDGICTIPWIYAYFLIKLNSYLGVFYSHILYILISLLILFPSFRRLSAQHGKLLSFVLIFSYPIIFGFYRGNSDFLIYGLILVSYFYGEKFKYTNSLIYLGSAIAFKPYQIFILLAYPFKILIKNLHVIVLGSILIIILIYIANNKFFVSSYKEIITCGSWYIKEYAIGDGGTLHNNSLWGIFKFIVYYFYKGKENQSKIIEYFKIYLNIWPLVLVFVFFLLNSFVKIFDLDKDKFSTKFFLICLLIPLLSPIVPDYRLFFINICLIIFISSKVSKNISSVIIITTLVFILIPKEFLWFPLSGAWFTTNGPLNCLALLFLLGYLVINSIKFRINLFRENQHK